MEETEKIEQNEIIYQYYVGIRLNENAKPYYFSTNMENLKIGDHVIIETTRGIELGTIISLPLPLSQYKSTLELKPVLHMASEEEFETYKENVMLAKDAFDICQEEIKNLDLEMRLISSEYTLDRSKIIFTYFADERVDFRDLLKVLASRLHCRIELRQIGTRDKAKIVGGIGICGLPLCCSTFLNEFDGISINRAKNQMLSLNIPKLSGHCGKLICCLKYEDDAYSELKKDYPHIGTKLKYNESLYRITSINVLTRSIKIENEEDVQFLDLDTVLKLIKGQNDEN